MSNEERQQVVANFLAEQFVAALETYGWDTGRLFFKEVAKLLDIDPSQDYVEDKFI